MLVRSAPVALPAARGALLRLGLALAAALVAAALLAGLVAVLAPGFAPPPRSPFGMGFREAAPSGAGSLGAWLLAMQAGFSRSLQAAVAGIRAGQGGYGPLAGLGFAYGVFHAAGPGHGKAVIAGYIVAGERALRRGLALSAAAALVQAAVAIALVGGGAALLRWTAAGITEAGRAVETAGFACVALLGLAVTWRKAGALASRLAGAAPAPCGPECGHAVLADAGRIERLGTWREQAGVVLAAGARPCAGAILVLVFALSQKVFAAGILAALAMAAGTALTTAALAALAVFAKAAALRLAGGRGEIGALALAGLELLAGAFVLVLGAALLTGYAAAIV
ncbi:high-affinity nickel-transporter [Methylobacterium sp. 4-46]|uniref:nickel/cobalt transporter n=1 Tax=unclassified Methylobacterium TaxID=2615210 RepID=UPI000165C69C|nr:MULTISPECIES: nickel transporter [Methylobacterium]ACA16792.1 high-affinity nickel-transporter [Methylobacterium sp. 4-46]WFT82487.1 nickel transporter [Methylobacterium nodulans]